MAYAVGTLKRYVFALRGAVPYCQAAVLTSKRAIRIPRTTDTPRNRPLEPLSVAVDFNLPRRVSFWGERTVFEIRACPETASRQLDCHHTITPGPRNDIRIRRRGAPPKRRHPPTIVHVRFLHKMSWSGKYDLARVALDVLMTNPKGDGVVVATRRRATLQASSTTAKFRGGVCRRLTHTSASQPCSSRAFTRHTQCPFDRYLARDAQAMSNEAQAGIWPVQELRCAAAPRQWRLAAMSSNASECYTILRGPGSLRTADLGGGGRSMLRRTNGDRFVFA